MPASKIKDQQNMKTAAQKSPTTSTYIATEKRVTLPGKKRPSVVYKGSRGAEYVRTGGKYMALKVAMKTKPKSGGALVNAQAITLNVSNTSHHKFKSMIAEFIRDTYGNITEYVNESNKLNKCVEESIKRLKGSVYEVFNFGNKKILAVLSNALESRRYVMVATYEVSFFSRCNETIDIYIYDETQGNLHLLDPRERRQLVTELGINIGDYKSADFKALIADELF